MNRGLKLIGWRAAVGRCDPNVTNLDPMNRGLKLASSSLPSRTLDQVTNLDPMNRGLKLAHSVSTQVSKMGYKPRPDE